MIQFPGEKYSVVVHSGSGSQTIIWSYKHKETHLVKDIILNNWKIVAWVFIYFQYFTQLRNKIISSQPPDKQSLMAQGFENLMDGIESNLMAKNRDRWVGIFLFFIPFYYTTIFLHLLSFYQGRYAVQIIL